MAFEYFLYNTNFNNTLVDRSAISFAPLPPNTGEIFANFLIPDNQPLFLYRESGSTIILNNESTIDDYLNFIEVIDGESNVTYSQLTGYTATTANGVSFAQFTGYTGVTAPATYLGITSFNSYSGVTLTNINSRLLKSTFNTYTGSTSSIQTANNGLTKSGSNVRLGGILTGNTTISLAANNLILSGGTFTIFNGNLALRNPANTFSYIFNTAAIAANRTVTMPLLTGNDTLVTAAFAQTLTSKTLTSPVINTQISGNITSGGNISTSNFLVGATAAQTLTNKTLTSPKFGGTGATYLADYSGSFGIRSLVDKGYVTGLTNTLLSKTVFNTYTGTTAPATYLNISNFNTYSGVTLTNINSRLLTSAFNGYSGTTQSTINNKLNTSVFNTFTGTTLPANYYNKTQINSYSATTLTNINSRLLTSAFNTYSANTVTYANNGLNRVGANVRLGGSLTGATTITLPATGSRLSFAGFPVQYTTDVSANYNARSLVDKGYVTGLTSTLSITANNGLNKIGTNVRLGGSLTGNTTITTATGSRLSFAGFPIQYSTDLSSSFVPRSLVDKGYVTGLTSNLVSSANNGIQKVGNNFRLGGALTGNTTISTESPRRLTFSGWPIQYATNLSADFGARSLVDKGYVTGLTSVLGVANSLYAFAKTLGNGTLSDSYKLSVVRSGVGTYDYTFAQAVGTTNYGVQIQPFNTVTDTNGMVSNITVNGFTVTIGEGDNGTTPDLLIDTEHSVGIFGVPVSGATTINVVAASTFNTYTGATATAIGLKANIASPTLTGIPAAPTAAVNTNTTQLATTAFVVGQAANVNPLPNGSVALGTSLRYARQDHVHATSTFGSERFYREKTTTQSTTSNSLITYDTFVINVVGGTYEISYQLFGGMTSASQSYRYNLRVDGTPLYSGAVTDPISLEFKDTTNEVSLTGRRDVALSAGSHTLILQFASEAGATARAYYGNFKVIRVA